MKTLLKSGILLLVLALTACANLGDGKLNPAFSDEFKENFGNGRIDVLGVSLPYAQAMVLAAEVFAGGRVEPLAKMIDILGETSARVEEIDQKYGGFTAQTLLKGYALESCGITRPGCRAMVEAYFEQMPAP